MLSPPALMGSWKEASNGKHKELDHNNNIHDVHNEGGQS